MGDISMLAMGLAVLAAVVAVGIKAHKRRSSYGASEHELGPFQVTSFDAIDDTVRRTRCVCGGVLQLQSEASIRRDDRELRAARCHCAQCGDTMTLTFDLASLHH